MGHRLTSKRGVLQGRLPVIALGVLVFVFGASAQNSSQQLKYEVASIRPAPADHTGGGPSGGPGTTDPTHVRYGSYTLRMLITTAYDVNVHQIILPAQLDTSDRYDIVANLPPGTTRQRALVMLQNLLVDRFHLKLHHETKVLPHYELTVVQRGPKLTPHKETAIASREPAVPEGVIGVRMGTDRNQMHARKIQMKELARVLADDLATPVLDRTGLAGEYDFDFEYSREELDGFHRSLTDAPEVSGAPILKIALQESLGLKLESKRGPIDTLVIDSGDRVPSEN
ncbi:MAG TPA: TIGR03435 family protein [Bryobacteraceae bacterium]